MSSSVISAEAYACATAAVNDFTVVAWLANVLTLRASSRRILSYCVCQAVLRGQQWIFALFGCAGIFFLGYAVLQVPSNLILLRLGAPTWLGVTIVAWGTVAALFAALRNTAEFYVLRFLLGITECGAFPGNMSYLLPT